MIFELRKFVDEEMISECLKLIENGEEKSKILGIDILSQLGTERKLFAHKLLSSIFELIQKTENEKLISSCLYAIGHNNKSLTSLQIRNLSKFKNSKSKEIRYALVFSLLGKENNTAIDTLIYLANDRSPKVRDWSLFGLGTQIETDNLKIRETLYQHCFDKDDQAKQEAIKGLASRNDKRAYELISKELKSENFGSLLFDTILNIKDGQLFLPELKTIDNKAREDLDISTEWKADLINCIEILESINVT